MLYRYALTEPKKRAVQSVRSGESPVGMDWNLVSGSGQMRFEVIGYIDSSTSRCIVFGDTPIRRLRVRSRDGSAIVRRL